MGPMRTGDTSWGTKCSLEDGKVGGEGFTKTVGVDICLGHVDGFG